MANVVGQLEIQLLANIARLQSDMDKATRSVDKAMSAIDKSVGLAQKALLGLGAGLSFGALIGSVDKAINTLGKLDDMAQKTGSSVENLSRLQKVATQFGGDFEAVNVGLNKFSKGLAGIDNAASPVAKGLQAIGISSKFVKDNDPSEVFIEVAKRLQNYQDGASKAALATDLFGKAGVELLPYLNDVAGGIDKFTGVSAESAAQAAKLQDDLGGLKVGFEQLTTTVTIGIIPVLDSFVGKLNQILQFKSIFSSVGGIDAKDYDKEIATRQESLAKVIEQLNVITRPTASNKINNAIFGDDKTLKAQIAIYTDEIKALKELKAARDAANASPYVSPNNGEKLNYRGAEAEAALAAQAKQDAADAKRIRDQKLKDLQDEFEKEDDLYQAKIEYEFKLQKEKEKNLAKYGRAITDVEADAYDLRIKNLNLLEKAGDAAFQERLKQEEEIARIEQENAKELQRSITDALLRGFESGKSFARNFIDTLKNLFQTLVLRPIVSFIVDSSGITKSLGLLGSVFSGNTSAAGATALTGTGSNSLFGAIKDLSGAIQGNLTGSIESLGAWLANGNGGIGDAIGGFLGTNASSIANFAPYAGAVIQALSGNLQGAAFTAAGAAIGSIIPGVGTAIGAVVGNLIGGAFGGGGHAETYAQANNIVSTTGNKFVSNNVLKGNGGGAGGYDVGINYAKFLGDAIGNLTKTFGGTIDKAFTLGVSYSSKYKNINAFIDNGPARKGYGDVYFDLNKGMEQNAAAQSFFFAVKKGLVTLPNILGDIIKRSEVTLANALDSVTQLQEINAINQSLKDLPPIFKSIGEAIKTIKLSDADALKARFTAINTYTGLFYTDAEKVATFTKQLTTTFTSLGVSLPTTRDGFRSLVDGIDTTTASGLGLFNALVDLAPTADSYYKALQAQNDATKQATDNAYALADALNTNKFKNVVDFTRAQRYQQNGIPLSLLPSYDVGTSYVPNDGPAMLHQGEAVLTKAENAARNGGGDSEIKSLLQQLIIEVRAGNLPQIQAAQRIAKILDRIDEDGIVISETDRSGTRTTLDTRVVA